MGTHNRETLYWVMKLEHLFESKQLYKPETGFVRKACLATPIDPAKSSSSGALLPCDSRFLKANLFQKSFDMGIFLLYC